MLDANKIQGLTTRSFILDLLKEVFVVLNGGESLLDYTQTAKNARQ